MARWSRPEVTVLWNGRPLEEWGVADALVEVSYTKTVGRTTPSKKYTAGKPKAGGASLKFELSNDEIARMLVAMVTTSERPRISLAFGWEGAEMFWTGGVHAGITRNRAIRQMFHPVSFKADSPTFNYGTSIPTLTISGVNDMNLTLSEKFKPRVFLDKTVGEILRTIADENGLVLDVSEMANANQRVESFISQTSEDDWKAVRRLSTMTGNGMVTGAVAPDTAPTFVHSENVSNIPTQRVAAVNSVQFKVDGKSRSNDYDWISRARNVLRISKMPQYQDLGSLEQTLIPILGWNLRPEDVEDDPLVIDCTSLTINAKDGYRKISGGATKPTGEEQKNTGVGQVLVVAREKVGAVLSVFNITQWPVMGGSGSPAAKKEEGKKATPPTSKVRVANPLPEELKVEDLTEEYMNLLMRQNLFALELSAKVTPGIPWLQAPLVVRVRGTHGHDGLYGIETSTITWGAAGMSNSLTLKPAMGLETASGEKKEPEKEPEKEPNGLPPIFVHARAPVGQEPTVHEINRWTRRVTQSSKKGAGSALVPEVDQEGEGGVPD